MTRLATKTPAAKYPKPKPGYVWVCTQVEGVETYSVTVLERKRKLTDGTANPSVLRAYAKLIMLDSGAVMAFFPLASMVSAQAKALMGATWFELATPLELPSFVFGRDMLIPAGRHPLVFILESWVVLFRPVYYPGHNHPG